MRGKGLILVSGLLLWAVCFAPVSIADDPASPAEEPAADEPALAVEPIDPGEKKPRPFALFVSVAGGVVSADELNPSIVTNANNIVESELSLDDQTHVRAALGWKLPEGKGAFRVVFQGTKEEEYRFSGRGRQLRVEGGETANAACLEGDGEVRPCLLDWWDIDIQDGNAVAQRFPPMWEPTVWKKENNVLVLDEETGMCILLGDEVLDDINRPELGIPCNGQPDPDEVRYSDTPDRVATSSAPGDLENQIQTVDLLYGREFGGRRYSSRWWGGLRYFEYTGNILAGAWLQLDEAGVGITEGTVLRYLNMRQDVSGFGPTGSWEADFNFFERGLELFLRGQSAFTFNSLDMDSGAFFFPADTGLGEAFISARMRDSRDKSSWQNTGEVGARVNFKNGLQIEAGFFITGYLDVVLLPAQLSGLDNFVFEENNVPEPDEALGFNTGTQDVVLTGWYSGVSYQF